MTTDQVQKNVAESIRAVAEQIMKDADEIAVGTEFIQSLRIIMSFAIDSLPYVKIEKEGNAYKAIHDARCWIWSKEANR